MDPNTAIERILEIESLTDELGDDEANLVLDWASKHAPDLVQGLADEDAAGEKVNALIAVLRQINRMAGHRKGQSVADVQAGLQTFSDLVAGAFGSRPSLALGPVQGVGSAVSADQPTAATQATAIASDLLAKPDQDFVRMMLAIAETAVPANPVPTPSEAAPPAEPTESPTPAADTADSNDDGPSLSG